MSYVSNSENIWEFLGAEQDWDHLAEQEEGCYLGLMSKDLLELEKLKLKKDAERLNEIMTTTDDGRVVINKDKAFTLHSPGQEQPSSSDEDDEIPLEHTQVRVNEERKSSLGVEESLSPSNMPESFLSDSASIEDKAYTSAIQGEERPSFTSGEASEKASLIQQQQNVFDSYPEYGDDFLVFMHIQRKLRLGMHRNVLKRNLSEDLTWSEFIEEE